MAKFTLKKVLIKVTEDEGNAFEVRGLSPNDISQLLMLHKPVMEQLFIKYAAQDPEKLNADDIAGSASEIAMSMLEQAPALVAHAIALAADDTDNFKEYTALPVGVQLGAIADIGRLTFETAGGSKKLLDLVKGLLLATTRSVPNPSLSTAGFGESGVK